MFKPIFYRSPNNYDADEASMLSAYDSAERSLTIQSQAEEADINTIVGRFGLTGELPVTRRVPFPVDFDVDAPMDYRQAMDHLNEASRSFMSLPAAVRSEFKNDPMAFADYAIDPENLPQLRLWGLAPPAVAASSEDKNPA